MKKLIAILPALALFLSLSKAGNDTSLTGGWAPRKEIIGKTEMPPITYKGQILTIKDSNYTFVAESVDKGIIRYHDGKMDIYGKYGVNAGRHITAIYKIEGTRLTICYNLEGKEYPTAFDTNGKETMFLCVFEKAG